jgi:hypothetical protein
MQQWLLGDALLGPDGAVLSWSNTQHPGYRYPEAAGLLLSMLCVPPWNGDTSRSVADRVAGWLSKSMRSDGGVGRDDTTYLFDSAVALAGFLRFRAAGRHIGHDKAIHRLRDFVCEQIAVGTAVLPRRAAADGRWSTQFGAHLLKSLHSLHLYARAFNDTLPNDIVATLINRSGHQPSPVYLHPFCYEQEGHLIALHHGFTNLFEPVDGALEWLAALQQPTGAILAFANGMEGFGEPRSDTTAQAVRLWLLRDRVRFKDAIARALAFLATCQTAEGGIRYSPGGDDICSWSTMFALQAVQWFVDQPCLDDLL